MRARFCGPSDSIDVAGFGAQRAALACGFSIKHGLDDRHDGWTLHGGLLTQLVRYSGVLDYRGYYGVGIYRCGGHQRAEDRQEHSTRVA